MQITITATQPVLQAAMLGKYLSVFNERHGGKNIAAITKVDYRDNILTCHGINKWGSPTYIYLPDKVLQELFTNGSAVLTHSDAQGTYKATWYYK